MKTSCGFKTPVTAHYYLFVDLDFAATGKLMNGMKSVIFAYLYRLNSTKNDLGKRRYGKLRGFTLLIILLF